MKAEILLRNVEQGDLSVFFVHQRDAEAVAMVAFSSRDAAAFDEHWARILADEAILKKTIVADGQVAGNIASFMRDGKREIGYWIDRALWGRGIATEALSAFLRLEQRRPLFAIVAKHNLASLRVVQKCGFTLCRAVDEKPEVVGDSHILLTLTAPYHDEIRTG